jgi:cold-inducible RNA-binding protein
MKLTFCRSSASWRKGLQPNNSADRDHAFSAWSAVLCKRGCSKPPTATLRAFMNRPAEISSFLKTTCRCGSQLRSFALKNIYVGNISFQTTEQDLDAAFSAYGQVDRVQIVKDRDTGQARGFAFVEMPVNADADKAMAALNGAELGGRTLTVNEARPREPRAGGGAGGGNRFGGGGGGGGRPSGGGGGGGRPPRREPRW